MKAITEGNGEESLFLGRLDICYLSYVLILSKMFGFDIRILYFWAFSEIF
ncbi:MAG: hypothetical protein KGZ49_10485 [Syntrophaceae bacterium]|nr:hypothetical protein [Syntrophaceae bacterium]